VTTPGIYGQINTSTFDDSSVVEVAKKMVGINVLKNNKAAYVELVALLLLYLAPRTGFESRTVRLTKKESKRL
jgi:hypothetical protein